MFSHQWRKLYFQLQSFNFVQQLCRLASEGSSQVKVIKLKVKTNIATIFKTPTIAWVATVIFRKEGGSLFSIYQIDHLSIPFISNTLVTGLRSPPSVILQKKWSYEDLSGKQFWVWIRSEKHRQSPNGAGNVTATNVRLGENKSRHNLTVYWLFSTVRFQNPLWKYVVLLSCWLNICNWRSD